MEESALGCKKVNFNQYLVCEVQKITKLQNL